MKLIIDIPERDYDLACKYPNALIATYAHYIKDGTPYEERPTGHWVPKKCNFYWYRQFACSECEHEIICHGKTPNFCEECGADMRGEEE